MMSHLSISTLKTLLHLDIVLYVLCPLLSSGFESIVENIDSGAYFIGFLQGFPAMYLAMICSGT